MFRRSFPWLCTGLMLAASAAHAQSFELEPRIGFPDFKFMPAPADYNGPVFVLSDDFPRDLPPLDPEVEEILSIDFEADPLAYAMAVRDYVFKGNIRGNGDVTSDFVLQLNDADRDWYHVPWQHWGSAGREGFHGLTREGPLTAKVLGPTQTNPSSAYAVGFYNGQGGWTIGQVWQSSDTGPDLTHFIEGKGFAEGTVVGKFLFTVLDEEQVPYLTDPLVWDAYMYNCDVPGLDPATCPQPLDERGPHSIQKMNLMQMDIMVKDSRATNAAAWTFGTFAYNGLLPEGNAYSGACDGYVGDSRKWCNLMPVGLMWGNDPDNAESFINATPTATRFNDDLVETWINRDEALPVMHLGFNSRLNGPADDPTSSCMSCHSTGQYPTISAIMPWLNAPPVPKPENGTTASADWMYWFRNFEDGEAFDAGQAVTLDFSMQLTKSIQNYVEYRSGTQGGNYAVEYWGESDTHKISRGATN